MTISKTIRFAVLTVGALACSGAPSLAFAQTTSEEWHKKSDTEKGADQIRAQSQGQVYANPDRQRALEDATNEGATSKPTSTPAPKKTKSGTANPR